MSRHIIGLLLLSFVALNANAQIILGSKSNKQKEDKQARRMKINEMIRNEEEGVPTFKKQGTFQFKLNFDGYGFLYELGKMKHPYKASIFQIGLSEKQHPKEEKQTSYTGGAGFTMIAKPFVYGKQNIFYQAKIGAGQAIMIGGKGNKNGVSVHAILLGGFSAGLLRPYYMEFISSTGGTEKIKFTEANRSKFLNAQNIVGGTGLTKGWGEIKFNPGVYAKTALRFDWARFNQVVSAMEFGFTYDFYSQKVVQMVDVPGKSFFPTGYLAIVFGNRK